MKAFDPAIRSRVVGDSVPFVYNPQFSSYFIKKLIFELSPIISEYFQRASKFTVYIVNVKFELPLQPVLVLRGSQNT